ncbi:hypothetical protein E2320_001766, partial [Naja naja]
TECHHNDEERALTGTWCTVELSVAVEKGYRIAEIYEVWHFERKTKVCFQTILTCISVKNRRLADIPIGAKQRKIKSVMFGIIKRTKGSNYLSSCEFVDDKAAVLTWKAAKNQPTKSTCTNVFIASFTTAYARLELYSLLNAWGQIERAWSPPLGDYLEQLTSEIPPNTSITKFAAAGPKTYGYALSNGSTVLKVKGITLNSANSVKVNFESLKDLINEYCLTGGVEKKEIKVQQQGIVRTKKRWALETRVLRKTLKVVYNK